MASKKDFPETLYVNVQFNGTGDNDYNAYVRTEQAIEEDGPTTVAEYKRVSVRKFRKDTVEC